MVLGLLWAGIEAQKRKAEEGDATARATALEAKNDLMDVVSIKSPKGESFTDVFKAGDKMYGAAGKFKVSYDGVYKPAPFKIPSMSMKIPEEWLKRFWPQQFQLMVRMNTLLQIGVSAYAIKTAAGKFDNERSGAAFMGVITAGFAFSTTVVAHGLAIYGKVAAAGVLQLGSRVLASKLLFITLLIQFFESLAAGKDRKVIAAGVYLVGGGMMTAGSVLRLAASSAGRAAALGTTLNVVGIVLSIGGALYEYITDTGPVGDWLESHCCWNEKSALYSHCREKFSYSEDRVSREKDTNDAFSGGISKFYDIYCTLYIEFKGRSGDTYVADVCVNLFDPATGSIEVKPELVCQPYLPNPPSPHGPTLPTALPPHAIPWEPASMM